jgi:hypothetical protein
MNEKASREVMDDSDGRDVQKIWMRLDVFSRM